MSNIVVEKILNGKLAEFCYLVHREGESECICIDPGYEFNRIKRYIDDNKFSINTILLTHGHFDHMLSCSDFQKIYNCDIYISKEDEEILYNSECNYSYLINKTDFEKFDVKNVKDNDILSLLGYRIKCISTPGHTKGGISYYFEDEKVLFSGDTLFYEVYGRVDLYSGNFEEIKDSIINKLFTLPNDVMVYPGHGYSTTIGKEKMHNVIKGEAHEL